MDTDNESMEFTEAMQPEAMQPEAMQTDSTSESMSIASDLMDDFEASIAAFMEIEKIHTDILISLQAISAHSSTCNIDTLKKMHADAMEHIKATGTSNFGELLLK